jgi:hypothetical protein
MNTRLPEKLWVLRDVERSRASAAKAVADFVGFNAGVETPASLCLEFFRSLRIRALLQGNS